MENAQSEFVFVVCKEDCKGGFDVWDKTRKDGTFNIAIDSTPDRDFYVCDLCNDVVHFRCSRHPESGYCDTCFVRLNPDSDSLL
jgi:hypothetical protein